MPVSREQVPTQEDINHWTHLSHIAVPALDAEVGILIGNNVPKATEPWEVVKSLGDGPYAVRSLLGWSIYGPLRGISFDDGQRPSVSSCCVSVVSNVDIKLSRVFNLDFSEDHVFEDEECLSVEDCQFLRMTEEGTVIGNRQHEVNLPLLTVSVPNSHALAVQQPKSMRKRFSYDPSFKMKNVSFNDDLIVKAKKTRFTTFVTNQVAVNRILSHFQDWFSLQSFVAWMLWTVKGLQRSLSKMVGSDPQTTSWVLFTSFLHSCEEAPWGSREWVDVSKLFSIVTLLDHITPADPPFINIRVD